MSRSRRSGRAAPRAGSAGRPGRPRSPRAARLPAALDERRMDPADLPERVELRGWRLASSSSGGSCSTWPTGRSSLAAVRSRQAASRLATARACGSSWPTRGSRSQAVSGSRSSVARLEPPALLERPLEPAGLAQAALELVGQLQQVGDVLGGVAELLGSQRARIPARVARGLADAQPEHGADQVAVAGLGALADEARRRSACRRCW